MSVRFSPSGSARLAMRALLAVWLLGAGARAAQRPSQDIRVRGGGGRYVLVRYTTDGTVLQRYTGFSRISDIISYDDTTILIAEQERDTISAMTLDGQIAWTIALHRPRWIQVLGPNRFLVCQDDPARVVEIDRTGRIFWQLAKPLIDAAGAVRMPDGNTAVVEGRSTHHAVHIFSPEGAILWTGTKHLAQPRGLVLLPTGELATSGFDTGQMVFFQPFTTEVRAIGFCCHAEGPRITKGGDLVAVTPEQQLVHAWTTTGDTAWKFKTFYPPYHVAPLADGTVLVAVFRVPDRQCLHAARGQSASQQPLAPYWRWLAIGIGPAVLVVLIFQWPALRPWSWFAFNAGAAPADVGADTQEQRDGRLSPLRRVEIGIYVAATTALAFVATVVHQNLLSEHAVRFWPYAPLVGLGGLFLALIQYRTPPQNSDWTLRMTRLAHVPRPTWRMWALWIVGIALLAGGLKGVFDARGEWVLAPWSAGLVLLAGGAMQAPATRLHIRFRSIAAGLLLFGALAFLRLYRLEEYPPNLHLDMAQWTVHVLRLLDGQPSTILSHGFAEVPLLGHVWSALWTAIAGRSLAGARFASVVGSLLAIAGVFFLVRRLYSTWAAVVAVVLLGVNHGFLHFSRIQAYMDPIPFHVLGILGLAAGLESGRYGWFVLAGLAGGYSALTYHAGRITPPIMMMLGALLLLRYPRAMLKRWPGLVLCAVALLGIIGPQAILYGTGRLNALGRREVYPFIVSGHTDPSLLWQTVRHGLPRVLGAFWFYGDTSTQYGSAWPVFFPPAAALLGMAVVAAVLRPWDIRGLWVVLWGFVILFAGGVLTIDPPFWPRFVTAFVPAAIAAAVAIGWLTRGATVAAGRVGHVIAVVSTCALLGLTSWQQLDAYRKYCAGIPPNESKARYATQWVQGIMGRDIQRWGQDAMMYIVAANPNWYSCRHPTIEYYAYDADVQDARDVTQYLPFKDPRTIVCYFLPGRSDQMAAVRRMYPRAEERAFYNNVGQHVFTRVVIRAPHARTTSRSGGLPTGR